MENFKINIRSACLSSP